MSTSSDTDSSSLHLGDIDEPTLVEKPKKKNVKKHKPSKGSNEEDDGKKGQKDAAIPTPAKRKYTRRNPVPAARPLLNEAQVVRAVKAALNQTPCIILPIFLEGEKDDGKPSASGSGKVNTK